MMIMMMMMNCFCAMVDRRKAFSLISSRDYCQRSSPSRISDTPRAGFEPVQNLSSGFVEVLCSSDNHYTTAPLYLCVHISLCHLFFNLQGLLTNQKLNTDNNFFNSFEFTTLSGNVTHSISDHLIQFVILEDFITNLCKRNFDKFDNNKLKEDLR